VGVAGPKPYSYQWFCNGEPLPGATLASLILTNAVAIAAGGYHNLALRDDGTVIAWGDDGKGQTDVPASLTNAVAIAAGGEFSLSLQTRSGRVYALEHTDSLTHPVWTRLPLVAGNGRTVPLIDATRSAAQRFYRVRQW
jgi:alpha-tubulin suppressor-like RCC1 family protein